MLISLTVKFLQYQPLSWKLDLNREFYSEGTELEKYTVGRICALSTETSAAMDMFDERHPAA